MAIRLKEDDKNEKAIRALLRKQTNRRCINCNSLGPQYVCLNFWTFVCTQCSGIHREFTHRVKSVSMSKFTSQEVANLENGGNEHAREIYFKDWDPQRQPLPDSSNVDRLRDFIKMVYVERRLSGERPRGRGADREGFHENRRSESRSSYKGESRSPSYEDRHEDKYANERGNRNHGRNSPLPIRPVKEILGDDVPPLFIGNNKSQLNGGHEQEKSQGAVQDGSGLQIKPSNILTSTGDALPSVPLAVKKEEPTSLIDFGADSESPTTKEFGGPLDSHASANTGWASFETFPTTATSLAVLPSMQPASTAVAAATSLPTSITQDQVSVNNHSQVNGNAQWIAEWPTASHMFAVQANTDNWSSFGQSSNLANNQSWNVFQESQSIVKTVPDVQMQLTKETPTGQIHTSQYAPGPSESNLVANPTNVKSTRAELPEDLFAGGLQINPLFAAYQPTRTHYSQMGGMGVGIRGYNQPQLAKSINPFDLPGDTSFGPSTGEFPNMASLHGALPNVNVGSRPLFRPASGGYGHQWQLDNSMGPGRVSYPISSVASAGVPFINQHIPNPAFPIMQSNRGIAGTHLSSPMQNSEPFSGAPMFPNHATSTSFGGYRSPVTHNELSFQNFSMPVAPELFQGRGFLPQSSVGSLNKLPSTGSGFPLHGSQQFIAQNTFGSFSKTALDTPFSVQTASSQTSLDPGGNPFG